AQPPGAKSGLAPCGRQSEKHDYSLHESRKSSQRNHRAQCFQGVNPCCCSSSQSEGGGGVAGQNIPPGKYTRQKERQNEPSPFTGNRPAKTAHPPRNPVD